MRTYVIPVSDTELLFLAIRQQGQITLFEIDGSQRLVSHKYAWINLGIIHTSNNSVDWFGYGDQRHFQQYFSHIVAVSFIGIGHEMTPKKSSSLSTPIYSEPFQA
jgi:hypothetical protein